VAAPKEIMAYIMKNIKQRRYGPSAVGKCPHGKRCFQMTYGIVM
jgi:hypothetical protein